MTDTDRTARWETFLADFYSAPNELRPSENARLKWFVEQGRAAWMAESPSPFFLPGRKGQWDYWYAICPNRDQRLWVRDLVRAHAGTWIDTDIKHVPAESTTPADANVHAFVGTEGKALRFLVAKDSNAVREVQNSLQRLTRVLATRPHRKVRLSPHLGTLIGDFWDACAAGSEVSAHELLLLIEQDHRLSKVNRLFQRLQFLATFERWDELEQLEQLPDLLRLDRPVLASDALARLALARLTANASVADFVNAASKFGALVPTVTTIRSAAGSQFYAFWSLANDESPTEVAEHLSDAGWLDHALAHSGLAALLTASDDSQATQIRRKVVLSDVTAAMEGKRFDAAIDLMAEMSPTAELAPLLVDALVKTFTPSAIALFKQWQLKLSGTPAADALAVRLTNSAPEADIATARFSDALEAAFSATSATQRTKALDELRAQSVSRLMRSGGLQDVIGAVRSTSESLDINLLGEMVDLLLDIERNLFSAAGDLPGIQELRVLTTETWALGDESGNRRRAMRVTDLVSRTLACGVNTATYGNIIDNLNLAWTPFLTAADLRFNLETLEVLAYLRPDDDQSLSTFAMAVLSRVGQHNALRLDANWLEVAIALGTEFGLDLAELSPPPPADPKAPQHPQVPTGTSIAIYSLMEQANARAASIIQKRYPGVKVQSLTEKVATDGLRNAAKTADILIIADKAAAHAATDALKTARGKAPLDYARGKGTVSLVEATESALSRFCNSIAS
ncbi:protein DpdD [Amycolatopsis sp. NPDC051371]|uniref:protein DpdD n=1 Tax=Amycolatopsis sp. NPDC051371 TaxID=3155800 RepID=UPI003415EF5C